MDTTDEKLRARALELAREEWDRGTGDYQCRAAMRLAIEHARSESERADRAEAALRGMEAREADFMREIGPVCDGGQYRADVLTRIRLRIAEAQADERRRVVAEAAHLARSAAEVEGKDGRGGHVAPLLAIAACIETLAAQPQAGGQDRSGAVTEAERGPAMEPSAGAGSTPAPASSSPAPDARAEMVERLYAALCEPVSVHVVGDIIDFALSERAELERENAELREMPHVRADLAFSWLREDRHTIQALTVELAALRARPAGPTDAETLERAAEIMLRCEAVGPDGLLVTLLRGMAARLRAPSSPVSPQPEPAEAHTWPQLKAQLDVLRAHPSPAARAQGIDLIEDALLALRSDDPSPSVRAVAGEVLDYAKPPAPPPAVPVPSEAGERSPTQGRVPGRADEPDVFERIVEEWSVDESTTDLAAFLRARFGPLVEKLRTLESLARHHMPPDYSKDDQWATELDAAADALARFTGRQT